MRSTTPGRILRTLLATAVLVQIATPARADDESGGVAAGPFRTVQGGKATLDHVGITLNGEKVRIRLSATMGAKTAIRLALPAFAWSGEGETYQTRQFPELAVDVDGRSVKSADVVAVSLRGKDITRTVNAAGLDPFAITETPPFVQASPGRRKAFDDLVATSAVVTTPEGQVARWTASRKIQVVVGRASHTLGFNYAARPALTIDASRRGDVQWRDYCLNPGEAAGLMANHVPPGPVIVRRYRFPATLDGAEPRTLKLRAIRRQAGTTIVCGATGAALVNPQGEVAVRAGSDGNVRLLRITAIDRRDTGGG